MKGKKAPHNHQISSIRARTIRNVQKEKKKKRDRRKKKILPHANLQRP